MDDMESNAKKKSNEFKEKDSKNVTKPLSNEYGKFNNGLDNKDCRGILINCLKNLEKEVLRLCVV